VAGFPGAKGRIPNFAGAPLTAARLASLPPWRAARVVKANPDAPQLPVRARALVDGKLLYMAVPSLTDERPLSCSTRRGLPWCSSCVDGKRGSRRRRWEPSDHPGRGSPRAWQADRFAPVWVLDCWARGRSLTLWKCAGGGRDASLPWTRANWRSRARPSWRLRDRLRSPAANGGNHYGRRQSRCGVHRTWQCRGP
jgi:hypothetical protein